MKTYKFKLIKCYPNSPKLNTVIEFNENQTLQYDHILADVANSPEFWRNVSYGDVEEEVDKIFDESLYSIREGIGGEGEYELDTPYCKKKIVQYIKQLLSEQETTN